jgi:TRAP transporter 4TM/12TM fusion protein
MTPLLTHSRRALLVWGAVFFSIAHLYTAIYGSPETKLFLMVHLSVAMVLTFMFKPLGSGNNAAVIDLTLSAVAFGILGYMLFNFVDWDSRVIALGFWDYVTGIALVILIAESVRRTVGWALLLVAGFFMVHALYADYFPGVFHGAPSSFESLLTALYIGNAGIFGVPLGVMANYVVLFIIFGESLAACGAGTFMTRFAFAVFGHRAGGPAKAAVVASGLMGSISGSAIANVLTTGAFTIPMMKKLGYRNDFAGGVEAAASTGGMIMPPVMGVTAFMMADFMGIPYIQVVFAAAIPAFLYYWGIYWSVHFEAMKRHLKTVPRAELPDTRQLLKRQGYLGIPLVTLTIMLFLGWSILIVALVGIVTVLVLSFVRKATRLTPMRLETIFIKTAKNTVSLSTACACAGIIIAAIFSTGLSFELGQRAIAAGGGHLWLILILAAILGIVLGMGITSSTVYITMVATVIPILKLAGVPDMAAHMFSMYYGVISNITPPVALSAFAAASLAVANPMTTGVQASRIGIAGFLVPFLFVYAPELLLIGSWKMTVWVTFTSAVGLACCAAGFTGYLFKPLLGWQRLLLMAAFVFLIIPETITDFIGFGLLAAAAVPNWRGIAKREGGEELEKKRFRTGWISRMTEGRIRREEGGVAVKTAENILMREEVLPGGEDEVTRSSLYGGWALLAVAALVVGLLGEKSVHAVSPLLWLAALGAVSLFIAAGLKLILKPNAASSHPGAAPKTSTVN